MAIELPSFASPPVVEVVMGVQFAPLKSLLAPHLGLFWAQIKADYPGLAENPLLPPVIEDHSIPGGTKDFQLQLNPIPNLPRVFFEHRDHEWILQIQRDRFLHNWRLATNSYPRYPEVRSRFFEQWGRFQRFAAEIGVGPLAITQIEITYLNKIGSFDQLPPLSDVFPDFAWRLHSRYLKRPDSCSAYCIFDSEDGTNRLRATIQPGSNAEDGKHFFVFELTVRGVTAGRTLEDWFDRSREMIVLAFADMTAGEWHKAWGRQ